MMAMSKKMLDEPSEIEMLLPWHAAGTLNARDARRVADTEQDRAGVLLDYGRTVDLVVRVDAFVGDGPGGGRRRRP
mgnify:CR=1 FL=1